MRGVLLSALGVAVLLAAALVRQAAPGTDEHDVTNRPIRVREDGYVSSSACRVCHPRNYQSWHASWHRTMTQVATPEAVVGDFDDRRVRAYGRSFRLTREGDSFWVEMDDPERPGAPGSPAKRVRRRILVTTGSHHEQDYWYETGHTRRLGFLPLMYLIEEGRWIPFSAGFLRPAVHELPAPAELDRWQTTCIKCHATHGKPRTRLPHDDRDMDTNVAELGIACEACHGPGGEHVRANRNPLRRYRLHASGAPDPTIVDPGRLGPDRASQVCGQCHGIHRPRTPLPRFARTRDDWRDRGLAYRPGDDLEGSRYLIRPERFRERRFQEILAFDPHLLEDRFWSDGMVRVSGREYNGLVESPCFRRGVGATKLSCLSCHRMHPAPDDPRPLAAWADDQLKVGMRGNGACLQCHSRFEEGSTLVGHTHHAAESSGSRCVNCHMPYTTYGLLKAIRSHTIDSPSVAALRDTGRPVACNQCHLDRTIGWTAERLDAWYGLAPPTLPPLLSAVPASIVWALAGDAGQRALTAWSFGWPPALAASASSDDWIAPFLAELLDDPYDAVRILAGRSLRRQPGFEDFAPDAMAPPAERQAAVARAWRRWREQRARSGRPTDPTYLIDPSAGTLRDRIFPMLRAQRNDRRVLLAE